MPRISLELETDELEKAVAQLSTEEQLRLLHKLERSTRHLRWDPLLNRIRQRVAKRPISERTIRRTCEEVRQELHDRSRR